MGKLYFILKRQVIENLLYGEYILLEICKIIRFM
nr:MAG TPA: hypothetical protein [Bacteriophage sp.]